jgi:hypothetical protein
MARRRMPRPAAMDSAAPWIARKLTCKLKYGIDPVSLDEVKNVSLEIGNAGLSLLKMLFDK